MTGPALVIGFGNPLRGDDGIGPAVAEALANETATDRCQIIVCHQLTPDLAEPIAAAALVIFIDAAVDVSPGKIAIREVQGMAPRSSGLFHAADPAALIDLAKRLYGQAPKAFLVTIGASSLDLGYGLSAAATAALPEAIAAVRALISERNGGTPGDASQLRVASTTDPSLSTN
jgi:hydrogenase maturation protease